MGLDIRWPIGLMFTLVGALLIFQGLITGGDTAMYQRSLGININLIWGAVLFVFGGVMTFFAWRGSKKPGPLDKP